MSSVKRKFISNHKKVAVYARVSSSGQDISMQINLADAYIKSQKIDPNTVIWIKDEDISANKLSIDQRPGMMELIHLITQKQVETVIAYGRDRLARNFVEYCYIVDVFDKHNVEVIFTAKSQPPYTHNLVLESIYGAFAQNEGKNIASRTNDARKQYPTNIFGYQRVGKKKNVRYKADEEKKEKIRDLFINVIDAKSGTELIEVLQKHKQALRIDSYEKMIIYLTNPFYCAKLQTMYSFEELHYVEPIITFDQYLKTQEVLKKYLNEVQVAIELSKKRGVIEPYCAICKSEMTFRHSKQLGQDGYYICRKKHKPVKIGVSKYNKLVSNHLETIIEKIPLEKIKEDSENYLKSLERTLKEKLQELNMKYKELQGEMIQSFIDEKRIKLEKIAKEKQETFNKICQVELHIKKIEEAQRGINFLTKEVKRALMKKIQDLDLTYVSQILFEKVEVSQDQIIFSVRFGKYLDEGGGLIA